MDHLGTLKPFMHAAQTGSYVAAGKQVGLSASAVGKAIARLEQHLGVRLFHRTTRSVTLTKEGQLFLARCHRIFEELEAAELELTQTIAMPSGRLRVSLPLMGKLLMPVIANFMETYPGIVLDLDFTDRQVRMIQEGFDVVISNSADGDSGLMRRSLGSFGARIVASPGYLEEHGQPVEPADLVAHACLRQRSSVSGKLLDWPLIGMAANQQSTIPETMSTTAVEPLIFLAERGFGIACLPPFAVSSQIKWGTLIPLLDEHLYQAEEWTALWPTHPTRSPQIHALVTFLAEHLNLDDQDLIPAMDDGLTS